MGLAAYKTAWQRQTKDFGHDQSSKYSCLIFDNRGIADSDKPLMRYSTSEMAKDTLEILDHVGWTGKRVLHVVGVSMGGMIAQELVIEYSSARGDGGTKQCVGIIGSRSDSFSLSGIDVCKVGQHSSKSRNYAKSHPVQSYLHRLL